MKKSKYVTSVESTNGDYLLYSALTGAVLCITKEKVPEFQILFENEIPESSDPLVRAAYESVLSSFKEAMILVDDDFDEIRYLQTQFTMATQPNQEGHIGLTISPTMKCNLACPYCFNPHEGRRSMDSRVRTDLQNYLKASVLKKGDTPRKLAITWTGGEPLYDMDALSDIAGRIYEVSCEQGYKVSANLLTNGVLLTERIVEKIKSPPICISSVQVTLDGPREVHNMTRIFKDGSPTFDIICRNIASIQSHIDVTIRLGINPCFQLEDFKCLVQELCERRIIGSNGKRLEMFFARVNPYLGDPSTTQEAMPVAKYAELELECAKVAKASGISMDLAKAWVKPNFLPCGNLAPTNYVIDVNGDLTKCFESMGRKEETIGNVCRGIDSRCAANYKWSTYTPYVNLDEECKTCRVLPLCKKGCPRAVFGGYGRCIPMKYNLKERMLYHYFGQGAIS